ncbi:hypothetical protein ACFW9D_29215 [Streptomyces sp. NPDC059524]|uniref:hypothetical protein n=1 Tax=Streptomyces sp. NPDC059524 TaxID=3346856 RepID=UPI003675E68E
MAAVSPASRLVATAARSRLRPLGLRQRGRSRIWLDDHGWWLGVVEFPSPQWSQGSGLTVGVMWLWQDVGHVTFDFVQQTRTESYRDETQFGPVAAELAGTAEARVTGLREQFADLRSATRRLLARPPRTASPWENFNAGVAAALTGDAPSARTRFTAVLAEDPFTDWIEDLQRTTRHLAERADDPAAVRVWATTAVLSCRAKLALADPPGPPDELLA